MSILKLFPTLISYQPLPMRGKEKFFKELAQEIKKIEQFDIEGQEWSRQNYPFGYSSYSSLNHLHQFSSSFLDLKNYMDVCVEEYVRNLEYDMKGRKLELTDFWANVMPQKVYHGMHIHPLSVLSGTIYVQVPKGGIKKNGGAFKIEDPRLHKFMNTPPRKKTCRTENRNFIDIEPKVGWILLFESYVGHEVRQNLSATERISVSFNYA